MQFCKDLILLKKYVLLVIELLSKLNSIILETWQNESKGKTDKKLSL